MSHSLACCAAMIFLIRLLGKPLCRKQVRVVMRIDVLDRLLSDGHATTKQRRSQEQPEKILGQSTLRLSRRKTMARTTRSHFESTESRTFNSIHTCSGHDEANPWSN